MLMSTIGNFDGVWDSCIPWILFAYLEVKVEGLNFSPFELMFGRRVKGPLSLMTDDWLNHRDNLSSIKKRPVIDFIMNLREKIRLSIQIANGNYEEQQGKIKFYYDRKTKKTEFEINQQVLVLLP